MDKVRTFTVAEVQGRIDKFLASVCTDTSRSELKKYFEEKLVLVNDQVVKPSYQIKPNDVVKVIEKPLPEKEIKEENIPLDILYEDEDVLVVNKPSGMVVHPAFGHPSGTLVNALMYHNGSLSNRRSNPFGIVIGLTKILPVSLSCAKTILPIVS